MSRGMNRVTLFGNVGQDPELRKTTSGVTVMNFRLATNSFRQAKDGSFEQHTEWHRIAVFGKRAEGLAKVLKKGSLLLVEGRLETSQYERDNERRYSTSIIANDVVLGGRNLASSSRETASSNDDDDGFSPSRFDEAGSLSGDRALERTGFNSDFTGPRRDERSVPGGPAKENPLGPPTNEPRDAPPSERRPPRNGSPPAAEVPTPRRRPRTPGGAPMSLSA
ncbi:MAG: single-stranded DNA-binding protein [Polyangiaceae bacterium]|nr:single-stranded DNA-binding protein [Polyangiaceae bacterium]